MSDTSIRVALHTPGVWAVSTAGYSVFSQARGQRLARADRRAQVSDDEARANMKLMAGAPRLLEACERVAEEMKAIASTGHSASPRWMEKRIAMLLDAARAAKVPR